MEYFAENIFWWHWIVLGIVLIASEIILPSFIIIWFGIAAVIVGSIDYIFQTTFTNELFLWAIFSALLLGSWLKFFKRDEIVSRVGQSEGEYKNTSGVITEDLNDGRFRAHFELPILGDRIWIVESQNREKLSVGDKIKVSKVYGQIVKVFKIEGE
ncbi:NfeD family protein [Hydrogenimonas thermophila]|uniref:Uncharacterized protein n=1 Tax=Hydrogenimonas thermophila TaxID=223786 RepID=A0A1I5SXV6_9BACT|nr:NfeD family protein [Hydrogenimonas thermophila]SFP75548.1 hypothetical protein SAMN05216234_13817 [Hydrogenimonas thermophila]